MSRTPEPPLLVRRLHPDARLPRRMSADAAGLDLSACLSDSGPVVLRPGQREVVGTGLAVAIPRGHEGQVRPRSGLAARHGLSIPNSPGTIDADYRGELKVILINLGQDPVEIRHGERIAQLVIAPVAFPAVEEVEELPPAERGEDGFGSTGR